jgi:hypothetical protein
MGAQARINLGGADANARPDCIKFSHQSLQNVELASLSKALQIISVRLACFSRLSGQELELSAPCLGGIPRSAGRLGLDFTIGKAQITALPLFHFRQVPALFPERQIVTQAEPSPRGSGVAIRLGVMEISHDRSSCICDGLRRLHLCC